MKRYGRYLYEWLLAVPMSYAFLLISPEDLGLEEVGFGTFLYIAIICAAFTLILHLRGRDRLIAIGAVTVFLGLPALTGLLSGESGYFSEHLSLWLVPGISAACFLAALLCRRFFAARVGTALILIGCLVAILVTEIFVPKLCVMLFLTVLLLLFADMIQLAWHRSGHTEHTQHLAFIAPFVIVWLLLCLLFPVGKEPYRWNFVRNIWDALQDLTISFRQSTADNGDDFDTFRPGFSADPHVHGGSLGDDSRVLMVVEPIYGTGAYLRLAGQYCDTFEDMTWRATVTEDRLEPIFDTLETRAAFDSVGVLSDYLQSTEFFVTYRKFSSRHLFTPDKLATERSADIEELGAAVEGRNLVYPERRGINNRYTVSGYRMNTMHPGFADFVTSFEGFDEESWQLSLRKRSLVSAPSYEELLAYRGFVRSAYLKPFELSETAASLVAAATAGEDNAFLRITKIARVLSGFRYSLSPGVFPDYVTDGPSFLDWFLTERRGYCTHYATALVFLAWSEGLPARYVHGFSVPMNGMHATEVKSDMAHAWCEIYFEGIGWIPFDCTPAYGGGDYWRMSSDPSGETPVMPESPDIPTPSSRPSGQTDESRDAASSGSKLLLSILFGLALLALFASVVLLLDRQLAIRRFRRLSDRERIPVVYRRNLRILGYLDCPSPADETLSEYRRRLSAFLPDESADWIEDYESFLYGTDADCAAVLGSLQRGNQALTALFKERRPHLYRLCLLGNRLLH